MCGIVAAVGNVSEVDIGSGCDALAHRGPDGSGISDHGWAKLGHRRLSIIDTEGGRQPLANEDQTCFVTFNGEIYNYLELRTELESAGHQFSSNSDTEVIVHSYEEWGTNCVAHLRGMFAFAIADLRTESLYVARDRLGIKPIVYSRIGDKTVVASELQALVSLANQQFEINPEAIHAFLRLGYIPAPLTIYKNVWKLPPASWLQINNNGQLGPISEYWDLNFSPIEGRSQDDWVDALDEVLLDSIRIHLRSDVEFGAFLSGGLDSSLVVSYMADIMERPVQTFSMGFKEEGFSECHYAKIVSELYDTQHNVETLSIDEAFSLGTLVNCYGEPFGDNSALPTMKLCGFAANKVKMVLSGDGGDELFAGYERYLAAAPAWTERKRGLLGRSRKSLGNLRRHLLGRKETSAPTSHAYWHAKARMFTFEELRRLTGVEITSDSADRMKSVWDGKIKDWHYLSQLQYMDVRCYLPGDILTKVDMASMRYGLEVRVPLLDHKVAEFAATVPPEFLVTADSEGNFVGKSLLKRLAERRFPRDFIYRKKQGFGIPIARWFGGIGHEELQDRLLGTDSQLTRFLSHSAVDDVITGKQPMRTRKIWLLLILQQWLLANHQGVLTTRAETD